MRGRTTDGGKEMSGAEIVEAALARKLWTTKGRRPRRTSLATRTAPTPRGREGDR